MENISYDQLYNALCTILILFGVLVTLDKGVEIIKKWRAPSTDTATKLANDKKRLDMHESAIEKLQKSSEVQCAALLALLDHALHNGSSQQMEKAKEELTDYLKGLISG